MSQLGSVTAIHRPIGPQGKTINFREAWKKAVDKFSPKIPEALNNVSTRFAEKLNDGKVAPKKVAGVVVPPSDDDDRIKFISMID